MLEDYYHIDNALHNIVWENNKKPILKGFPNIDFSYSHTKGAILCGITKNSSIGVDIELANTPPYEIMPLVFHPNEICYVNNSLRSKKQAFYKIWTQKEAFTKRKRHWSIWRYYFHRYSSITIYTIKDLDPK